MYMVQKYVQNIKHNRGRIQNKCSNTKKVHIKIYCTSLTTNYQYLSNKQNIKNTTTSFYTDID